MLGQLLLAAPFVIGALYSLYRRRDWVSVILCMGIALGFSAWQLPTDKVILSALVVSETAMALALLFVCIESVNRNDRTWSAKARRGQIIGLFSVAKVGIWIFYAKSSSLMSWNTASALANGVLVFQIIVSGGFGDVVIKRICDAMHRVRVNVLRRMGYGKAY